MVKARKQEVGNSDLVAKLLVLSMMPQSLSPVQELLSCELWGGAPIKHVLACQELEFCQMGSGKWLLLVGGSRTRQRRAWS